MLVLPEPLWLNTIKVLVLVIKPRTAWLKNMDNKKLSAFTTRFSAVSSTIRATLYKQGLRNLIKNIFYGSGYEGVIEIYEKESASNPDRESD